MELFDARIMAADRSGAYVVVPAAVVTALGGKGRIPVQATFDGIAYRGSVVSMGGPDKILGVLKDIQRQLGKGVGDVVQITLERDATKRRVTVPDDLGAALAASDLTDAFADLSYSHQREYVGWIDEAKRAPTRAKRVAETVERLRSARRG